MAELTVCQICGHDIVKSQDDICSDKCRNSEQQVNEFSTDLKNYFSEDPRVFFYDVGFGKLCDILTVLIIKRNKQTVLNGQLETDFQIGRIKQSILTKVNRACTDQRFRKAVNSLIHQLFLVNSNIWRKRSKESKENYFDLMKKRDELRKQLEAIVDGRTRTNRVYD